MSVQRITSRYAKSLLDLASERGELTSVKEDISGLLSLFDNSQELRTLVKSPVIKPDTKVKAMDRLFNGKVQTMTLEFLKIVIRKGRESLLPEIAQAFIEQYRSLKGIAKVHLTSAAPLSAQMIEIIEEKVKQMGLDADKVEFETEVDPALIGGFVLSFEDKLYDASVSHRLNTLKKELIQ